MVSGINNHYAERNEYKGEEAGHGKCFPVFTEEQR